MNRAQISLEFLFALGAIFFIFLIIVIFTTAKQGTYIRFNDVLAAQQDCQHLATAITTVFITGVTHTTTTRHAFTIVNASRAILINDVSCSIPLNTVISGTFIQGKTRLTRTNDHVEVRHV